MIALLGRRFAGLILTLVVVSFLIFAVMDLLPGDPASIMLGTSATPETLAALRHELGLDQPLLFRYGQWVAGVFSGDLGQSYTYGVPVAGLILERLAVTLPLALIAILLSVCDRRCRSASSRPRGETASSISSRRSFRRSALPFRLSGWHCC